MKKALTIITILLCVVLGLLWSVKHDKKNVVQNVAGEKIENKEVASNTTSTPEVKITFLDVGQGDASFIEFLDGEQMLVDCSIDARIIEALGRVMPYYDHDIDYLLVTHPDSDHYGGCVDVLKRFEVKHVVYNGLQKDKEQYWNEFMQAVKDEPGSQYIELVKEDTWNIASSSLHFLYPDHSLEQDPKIPGDTKETNTNNSSIVFTLACGKNSVLFTGDMETLLEQYLVHIYGKQLDTDILKVGHHGSDSSSAQEFLDLVTPKKSVISVGAGNKFGHPSRRVLKRLDREGSNVLRTDVEGDITIEL
jgi:competence protein ComEC